MTMIPKPDFERYLTALACKEPDRVPLGDFVIDQLPKENFLGRKLVTLEDHVDLWHAAGFDYITAYSGIREPELIPKVMTVEGEGVHTEYGEKVSRKWALEHEGVITNWEQFERFPWPSIDKIDLSKWDAFGKLLPPGMKAILLLGSIYTFVWMYMGAENFFNALENNEELIAALFEKVGKFQYEVFLRVIEYPCVGAVINPDDIAHNTGTFIHPKYLRKYLFPWYKKMGSICRNKGLGFVFHSDGDCSEVMDDLIDCEFHGFHPVQPNAMDIEEVKKKWGDRLCLLGNINLDSTLTLGAPEDVRAEVYERIRTIGPGGGYMVSSSNTITDYVPLTNMKALIDAVFEFGQYPISLEKGRAKGTVWKFQAKPRPKETLHVAAEMELETYVSALLDSDIPRLIDLVQKNIDSGVNPSEVVEKGMIPAMTIIGKQFQGGQIYIPEMMLAAKAMSDTLAHFKNKIVMTSNQKNGTVIIGTVKGDLHDIGKNLVMMMLEGQGFTVRDLGTSVSPEQFVRVVRERKPDILAMSALLTTTMIEMRSTLDALKESGLREKVKVIVGGAPVTQNFADQIGADGYAYDAPGAAQKCRELLPA
jgi:corrinoid protein of di/trimethylamine methyltransferase